MKSPSLEEWKLLSEIYSNVLVGTATIIGAAIGLPAILKNWKINRLRRQYPASRMGVDFKVADTASSPGKYYLFDINRKSRRWIESSGTFLDLNFYWDKTERMSQKEFESYTEEPGILTSGKRGH